MNKKSNLNHLDYWSERSDEIFRYLDRKDIDFFAELNKVYQEQANEMQKAFYDFVSKYSENGSMSYQEALQRLKGTDLSDYRANAKKYREQAEKDPELLKRLNEQYTTARATRLESLQLDMLFRAGVARGIIAEKFESYLQKMALMGYKKAMSGRTGTINEPALKELVKTPFNGYNYSQQLWGNTDNLVKDLKKVLKVGFVRGDHPRTMARDLAQRYKVANSRAETLVRTDGTMIVNRSAIQRYKDAGLKYYRILVHLDNRTTEICKRIHAENKRYLIDEMQVGVNAPPFHFGCRSGVMPDEEELNSSFIEKKIDVQTPDYEKYKTLSEDEIAKMQEWSDSVFNKKYKRGSNTPIDGISNYTQNDYGITNEIASGRTKPRTSFTQEEVEAFAKKKGIKPRDAKQYFYDEIRRHQDGVRLTKILDESLSHWEVPRDLRAYRKFGFSYPNQEFLNLKPGDTVIQDSFMSTTLDLRAIRDNFNKNHQIIYEIEVPKGTNGAYVGSNNALSYNEKELLFHRGMKMEVLEIENTEGRKNYAGFKDITTRVKVRIVGREPKKLDFD